VAVVSLHAVSALSIALRIAPAALALACSPGPIDWDDPVEEPASIPLGEFRTFPAAAHGACAANVAAWQENGVPRAAWWSVRPDSAADLVMATMNPDKTWSAPVRLDTADVGKGCRPAPAVAVDGANLHIVYPMEAREGPGFFLTHSMDRGLMFHSPVAVVYGRHPGRASIAAAGNFVVVAYEDPNSNPTRISVAISSTMAHLFDYREVISGADAAASRPMVSTDGKSVTVRWSRAGMDSTKQIVRRGTLR
jgi:hypothetical protein